MTTEKITPEAFLAYCQAHGLSASCSPSVVTVTKHFDGTPAGFAQAETDASILYDLPRGCGSIWGTDGGSIGGMVAMQTGHFTLNVSGVHKRFISKLAKLGAPTR